MKKKIYLDVAWTTHSILKELIMYPPEGYEFITAPTVVSTTAEAVYKGNLLSFLSRQASRMLPLTLIKAYVDRFIEEPPKDAVLTYSFLHLVFRNEPWVMDIDYVATPIGLPKHFNRYKRIVENRLASPNCKRIICRNEAAKKSLLLNLDCTTFEDKIEMVRPAVRPKNFAKVYSGNKTKILFVGSANYPNEFAIKGGREVLEAFLILCKRYDDLELVIRASGIPEDLKRRAGQISSIKSIQRVAPPELLEHEFKTADIFLFPCHWTPWQVMLDAMSYELPIVTIDAWANPEIVEGAKTGLVVKKSKKLPYYIDSSTLFPAVDTPQFLKALNSVDPKVVEELVEKTSILIENVELRRRMGKAGRWEVEHGKFSIKQRNDKLKRIFDEAIGITP